MFARNHARVGLYERTVVLVSRYALDLVDPEEFAALVAHELAHEYVWEEYDAAMKRFDRPRLQQLELHCDGLAVLILRRVGIDPERLVSAVQTLTRYNERLGATNRPPNYVSLTERAAFVRSIAKLAWPDASSLLAATEAAAPPK